MVVPPELIPRAGSNTLLAHRAARLLGSCLASGSPKWYVLDLVEIGDVLADMPVLPLVPSFKKVMLLRQSLGLRRLRLLFHCLISIFIIQNDLLQVLLLVIGRFCQRVLQKALRVFVPLRRP